MRQGQQGKRMRGRGGRKGGSSPSNRSYESNGPDVKVRGTAAHIAEKYVQLARDAASSGDPVASENYLQHAEHYFRILAATQPPEQRVNFSQNMDGENDNDGDDDGDDTGFQNNNGHANGHIAGRGEQPSEIVELTGGNTQPQEHTTGEAGSETETPVRRSRGRTRRQPVRDGNVLSHGERGSETDAPARSDEDKAAAATLDA